MEKKFSPRENYESTKKKVGYVSLEQATNKDWERIGFKSGLEVHQQLHTVKKLFCRCPAGIYQHKDEYDAELIRHMRPTLSELGEYDGTALMEFKTKKEIIYRISNDTACTYDVDDTPPFRLNREALEIALMISLLCKQNIVGEIHITRKQYLDGSIPTGFQRTAILGVEGEISLKNKKVRLIQLSIEEDSCREVSDIGHVRTYTTDRLGMPLIEVVTYPDMLTPYEVREACDYIRFLNRSTGKVRIGPGAGREDVNVSCSGGTRVEIKGVSHTKWIPRLTHNEAFRQWSLLNIREILKSRVSGGSEKWKIDYHELDSSFFKFSNLPENIINNNYRIIAINLPDFKGIISHFTQPGKIFADELSDRLKVIACIEKPNMTHSEEFEPVISNDDITNIQKLLKVKESDAQIIIWGPTADMKTAIETIEERCKMAFEGVPNETRKSFRNGTTIFERVLPGADRMYPDTDSKPIPLEDEHIDKIRTQLPLDLLERYEKLIQWGIPEDTIKFIFRNNYFSIIEKIINELGYEGRFTGAFFGHTFKYIIGHYQRSKDFTAHKIYDLFKFVKDKKLDKAILKIMLPEVYEHPKMDFNSVLDTIKFRKLTPEEIIKEIPYLQKQFEGIRKKATEGTAEKWIMGELHRRATGNISLNELSKQVVSAIK